MWLPRAGKTSFFVYNQSKIDSLPTDRINEFKHELTILEEGNKLLIGEVKSYTTGNVYKIRSPVIETHILACRVNQDQGNPNWRGNRGSNRNFASIGVASVLLVLFMRSKLPMSQRSNKWRRIFNLYDQERLLFLLRNVHKYMRTGQSGEPSGFDAAKYSTRMWILHWRWIDSLDRHGTSWLVFISSPFLAGSGTWL